MPLSPNKAQHAVPHVNCPACEELRRMFVRNEDFGKLTFSQAGTLWLAGRKSISEDTIRDYKNCLKPLNKFFGELTVSDIHIGYIQAYQDERRKSVGPVRVNREIGVVLSGVLTRAGLWEEVGKFYEALPFSKKKSGLAMEPEEERYLWQIASQKPRWHLIYWCTILARNTCLGTKEVRMLRLGKIDQKEYKTVTIEEFVKNDFRERTLKCNSDAQWALQKLAERAAVRGAYLPEHYLFPHRGVGNRKSDPTRPQTTFLHSWRQLRKEVAKKYPHLANVRFYDNRHTANTRLLENPAVPYNVIEHYMGHQINSQTKRLYDHIRDSAIQAGSDALSSGHYESEERNMPTLIERKRPDRVFGVVQNGSQKESS